MTIGMAVHGGAGALDGDLLVPYQEGCRLALEVGLAIVDAGGTALEAVEAAIRVLEDEEIFDAGYGSYLNELGAVTLDAGIMDGATLATGSVCHVAGVSSAIAIARKVLDSPLAVLVGDGAVAFAREHGITEVDPSTMVSPRALAFWKSLGGRSWTVNSAQALFGDTVGAVALDSFGDLAAGTSTGGAPGKPVGRVGDSPFIGAGVYANNHSAAVSTTGHGELIIPVVWAKSAADLVRDGQGAAETAAQALALLQPTKARGGLISLDRTGRAGVAWNTPHMAYARLDPDTGEVDVGPVDDARTGIRGLEP
jgi:beta-aspartyl-peptidase (threonine type)